MRFAVHFELAIVLFASRHSDILVSCRSCQLPGECEGDSRTGRQHSTAMSSGRSTGCGLLAVQPDS